MPHLGEFQQEIVSPAQRFMLTPLGSPFTYTALQKGSVFVAGGTINLIEVLRAGVAVVVGATGGVIPLSKGDTIRITYLIIPATVAFLPEI